MTYFIGALAGLIWGALGAFAEYGINLRAVKKSSAKAMLGANILRVLIDLALLAAVFLLRDTLPFSFVTTLIGSAASLALLGIVFAFRIAGMGE